QRASPQKPKDVEIALSLTPDQVIKGGKAKVSLPEGRAIAVSIPDAVEDGQVIRLKGQGPAGLTGHRADVLARVRFVASATTRIVGRDIFMDIPVPIEKAVKGGKTPFQTPDGKIAVKIEPWTDNGHKMRIKGRGLPKKTGGRGDLYGIVRLTFSDSDREALRAAFTQEAE
ncbi:MAG: DnaJ C-terminal domain-containing protein, partial [Pseudomonadota bacterium]